MTSTSREQILNGGIEILRENGVITMDSVARKVGMSKAGIIHHFRTKEILMTALLDQVADRWEAELEQHLGNGMSLEDATLRERLLAFLDASLAVDHDPSDLVVFASPEFRQELVEHWTKRSEKWLIFSEKPEQIDPTAFTAVRLIADGAWLANAANLHPLSAEEIIRIREFCTQLLGN